MRRAVPAATGALLVAALALGAAGGAWTELLVVLVVVGAAAAGWAGLLALPSPRGSALVVGLAGAVSAVVVASTSAPGSGRLRRLPAVLALAVLAAFVHQLLRRDGRPRVVDGVSGVVAGVVVTGSGSGWVAAADGPHGARVVAVAAAALVLALAAAGAGDVAGLHDRGRLAVLARWWWVLLVAVGGVVGAVAALAVDLGAGGGALLGAVLGLVVGVSFDLLGRLPAVARTAPALALGAAPVAAAGLVVEAAALLLGGRL